MQNFYLLLSLLSGVFLLLEFMARVFFGKTLIPDQSELFERKKSRVEWQTVFPKNMLRLIIFVFVAAVAGLFLDLAGFVGWISMPLAAVAGLVFNFLLSTVFSKLYFKARKAGEPSPAQLEGMSGVVTEEITADEYGTVKICAGGGKEQQKKIAQNYYFAGASANGRTLPAGTRVVVIYCEDGLCFVESEEHFFDVLFEEESAAESDGG